MQIITPAIKDKVLYYLATTVPLENFAYHSTEVIIKDTETNYESFEAIVRQFERFGLIRDLAVGHINSNFIIQMELHDFAQKGGFVAQEEIFEANIKKLLYEVDNLKKQLGPDQLEQANKISAIAAAIFAGLSLFKK